MNDKIKKEVELSSNVVDMAYDLWKNAPEHMKNNNAAVSAIKKERRRLAAVLLELELEERQIGLTKADGEGNYTEADVEEERARFDDLLIVYCQLLFNETQDQK